MRQSRQRPRRASHESTGTLSYGRTGCAQPGQCEPGVDERLAARQAPRHDVEEGADEQAAGGREHDEQHEPRFDHHCAETCRCSRRRGTRSLRVSAVAADDALMPVEIRSRVADQGGFTIVEVLVAAVVLVVGLGALLQLLITADHTVTTTRLRQVETSLAREVLEDSRGLASTQLTQATIASALQSAVPQATLSGSNLVVTRAVSSGTPTSFTISFNVCDLDAPSDGYGNHASPPPSGGVWCPDVGSSGTQDSNPSDYKRVSVTVTPRDRSTPVIEQTILIYSRPVNGPAVTCLSTSATCPGPDVTVTSGSSLTFNVTHDGDRRPHPVARQRQCAAERADPGRCHGSVCAVRHVVVVHVELPDRRWHLRHHRGGLRRRTATAGRARPSSSA